MCTAIIYKTKDAYFGRTLDIECSYGEEVVVTPRNFPLTFRHAKGQGSHYAIIGMGTVRDGYPPLLRSRQRVWTWDGGA